MNEIYDYTEAGFKIFGLYGVDNKGRCECGHPDCLAIYKHPRISNWQNVPDWSDEQLETFTTLGHFKTGFGALCAGWLVIDVDARNGGVESFRLLCADIPESSSAAFVVNTGSGNGSQHHYFRMPFAMPLSQQHHRYKGIDFKTSGYVVGAGSMHASGDQYETDRGYPQDITDAPQSLIDLLKKPERHRVDYNGGAVDVSDDDVAGLLGYISPDGSYEEWVKVGMAVHHCTGGTGFALWDEWSAKSKKYPGTDQLHRHWHSFGKSASPAGYGTLMHYARAGGYVDDVTFEYVDDHEGAAVDTGLSDLSTVDLLRPPGFVGDLSRWINAQCLYPRENLAVAAALQSVSALAGMRFVDELDHITPNLISFCVAGSGTGKEAVQQAYLEVMRAAGIQGAVHGGFKSEQELYRNLIRHQAAFYVVDELGLVLRKLDNAGKKGGAAYLEGIIGTVMSVFSKAKGFLPVTGDLKEEIREALIKELS
ncbi:MAG TPA: PriCT-2 domain-containing protein, partial [Halothiobacillus sp.]|nr:PriCT-2 domain-containing protein [Halothiobacillus sp.]